MQLLKDITSFTIYKRQCNAHKIMSSNISYNLFIVTLYLLNSKYIHIHIPVDRHN